MQAQNPLGIWRSNRQFFPPKTSRRQRALQGLAEMGLHGIVCKSIQIPHQFLRKHRF